MVCHTYNHKYLEQIYQDLIIKYLICEENIIKLPPYIKNYIYVNDSYVDGKVLDLSKELASLFIQYENDLFEISSWQKDIYDGVLELADSINYLSKTSLSNDVWKKHEQIYLFNLAFLNNYLIERIIELAKYNDVYYYLQEVDGSYKLDDAIKNASSKIINIGGDYKPTISLTAAPSILKEVQNVHSNICALLKDPQVSYSDILVVAPDINQYETTIRLVFHQDNVDFVNIPYFIDKKENPNKIYLDAIEVLADIASKQYFTRAHFYKLINNEIFKKQRSIDDEDIEKIMSTLVNLNIFRNHEFLDEWDYLKKRLLLAKLVDHNVHDNNIINLNGTDYISYETLDLDDDRIVKIVNLIDDIKDWMNVISFNGKLDDDAYDCLINQLNHLFIIPDEPSRIYQQIVEEIKLWQALKINNLTINAMLVKIKQMVDYESKKYHNNYVKGITFTNLNWTSPKPYQYVFMMGMSSNNMPRNDIKSELDERNDIISKLTYDKYAFFAQYQNALKGCYFSYVNIDLATEAEYFKSSFVLDVFHNLGYLDAEIKNLEKKLTLDETRPWDELYTKKEFKLKTNSVTLNKGDYEKTDLTNYQINYPTFIKMSDLISFLQEPYNKKINTLLGKLSNNAKEFDLDYEDYNLDNLCKYHINKELFSDFLENKNPSSEEIIKKYKLDNTLVFAEQYSGFINDMIMVTEDLILNNFQGFTKFNPPSLDLNAGDITWHLEANRYCYKKLTENGIEYLFADKKVKSNEYLKNFMNIYIQALADIAMHQEMEYHVELTLINVNKNPITTYEANLTPTKAKEILNKIYLHYIDYENIKFINAYFYRHDLLFDKMETLINGNDFIIKDENFKLVEGKKDSGYLEETFEEEFKKVQADYNDLFIFEEKKKTKNKKGGNK